MGHRRFFYYPEKVVYPGVYGTCSRGHLGMVDPRLLKTDWTNAAQSGLEEDPRATLKAIYDLATLEFLPYDFTEIFRTFKNNVTLIAEKYSSHMEFSDLLDNICDAERRVLEIQNLPKDSLKGKASYYNDMMKLVARNMTNIAIDLR